MTWPGSRAGLEPAVDERPVHDCGPWPPESTDVLANAHYPVSPKSAPELEESLTPTVAIDGLAALAVIHHGWTCFSSRPEAAGGGYSQEQPSIRGLRGNSHRQEPNQ